MAVRDHTVIVRDAAPLRSVAFGSCQERETFPTKYAPNRLGNELSLQGAPHRGPGCYDSHIIGTILYDVQKRPESIKGYAFAARTASRFLPSVKTVSPSPQQKQDRWPQVCPFNSIPFNTTTQRFKTNPVTAESNPGPGSYDHDSTQNRKVAWPMKFGSPDWGRVPQLESKALRTKLPCDKEFVKQRSRMAYLQLFYS
ncbi:hypothetical protein UPYG_G00002430 [Umbra pygmaea]|uniref:Protein pitchfork n=1 Tax=Umbra pygmaea TaxID=75934 RepID=A0ABD0XGN4_UMBPY